MNDKYLLPLRLKKVNYKNTPFLNIGKKYLSAIIKLLKLGGKNMKEEFNSITGKPDKPSQKNESGTSPCKDLAEYLKKQTDIILGAENTEATKKNLSLTDREPSRNELVMNYINSGAAEKFEKENPIIK